MPALIAVSVLGTVLTGADLGRAASPIPPDPTAITTLSNEQTLSRWAHAEERAIVRRRPAADAPVAGRLHFDTEDGFPEVYLALSSFTDPAGVQWVEVRLPARPNGQTGWVPRTALGPLQRTTLMLEINRSTTRATLRRDGKVIWHAPVGVGKPGTPTPVGHFYVRERLTPPPGTIYGALAYGLSAYAHVSDWPGGGVVGIHGTDQPRLIPGRPSHGCIRVRPADLRRLGRLLKIGTPVRIR